MIWFKGTGGLRWILLKDPLEQQLGAGEKARLLFWRTQFPRNSTGSFTPASRPSSRRSNTTDLYCDWGDAILSCSSPTPLYVCSGDFLPLSPGQPCLPWQRFQDFPWPWLWSRWITKIFAESIAKTNVIRPPELPLTAMSSCFLPL